MCLGGREQGMFVWVRCVRERERRGDEGCSVCKKLGVCVWGGGGACICMYDSF